MIYFEILRIQVLFKRSNPHWFVRGARYKRVAWKSMGADFDSFIAMRTHWLDVRRLRRCGWHRLWGRIRRGRRSIRKMNVVELGDQALNGRAWDICRGPCFEGRFSQSLLVIFCQESSRIAHEQKRTLVPSRSCSPMFVVKLVWVATLPRCECERTFEPRRGTSRRGHRTQNERFAWRQKAETKSASRDSVGEGLRASGENPGLGTKEMSSRR
ncbi:hypothetical protein C8F01DRAFT_1156603 [Mycena amicta]|nr:hypothetical protein C8F01DRAFT_1156603 [Mycena amicta]